MGKYDIKDAHKLKVFMQEIQLIADKYAGSMVGDRLNKIPEELKETIEWIAEMMEKKV
jgi:hypothetical protein